MTAASSTTKARAAGVVPRSTSARQGRNSSKTARDGNRPAMKFPKPIPSGTITTGKLHGRVEAVTAGGRYLFATAPGADRESKSAAASPSVETKRVGLGRRPRRVPRCTDRARPQSMPASGGCPEPHPAPSEKPETKPLKNRWGFFCSPLGIASSGTVERRHSPSTTSGTGAALDLHAPSRGKRGVEFALLRMKPPRPGRGSPDRPCATSCTPVHVPERSPLDRCFWGFFLLVSGCSTSGTVEARHPADPGSRSRITPKVAVI